MQSKSSSIKPTSIIALVSGLILSFALVTETYAARGCCSRHGGVAGCNTSTGYLKCKDGTQSPSCKCSGETTKPTKTKTLYKSTTATPEPLPSPVLSVPASTDKKPANSKGCCRGHGGVGGCDSKSGHLKCKDGTVSPSCQC